MVVIANWDLFNIVRENAVNYMFGSYGILALIIIIIFLILIIGSGIEFRYAILFTLPVVAGFGLSGWFVVSWVVYLFLMIAAVIYAVTLIRLFGQ